MTIYIVRANEFTLGVYNSPLKACRRAAVFTNNGLPTKRHVKPREILMLWKQLKGVEAGETVCFHSVNIQKWTINDIR